VLDEYKGEKAIAVKVVKAAQGIFLNESRFYMTPYVGKHGWVSLRISESLFDWEEIEGLVKGSYQLVGGSFGNR